LTGPDISPSPAPSGNAIAFVSLFSKIWKIQMIYKAGERFRRIKVGFKDILPYASVLMIVVLGILVSWQAVDPFIWTRTVQLEDSDGLALESYGECSSDEGWSFLVSLLCFQLVYLMYALVLCWQTKDIPTDFAESNYVSLCVMCIFQVSILAIPIAAMVRDDSTAFYFVRACAVFLQNFTVLCLMFIPKMWRVFQGDDALVMIRHTTFGSNDRLARGYSGQLSPPGSAPSSAPLNTGPAAKESWRASSHASLKNLRGQYNINSSISRPHFSSISENGSNDLRLPMDAEVTRLDPGTCDTAPSEANVDEVDEEEMTT
jgi:7 transmembrane sweet-taste receptor of 3 GCPR